jgi:hypothetical protein
VRAHGLEALWVETDDGKFLILPAAWTDWRPQAGCPALDGRTVRLAPEATQALAAYVAARRRDIARPDDGVLCRPTEGGQDDAQSSTEESPHDRAGASARPPAGRRRGRRRMPASVVEQAGAPKIPCGSQNRERGGR